MLDKGVDRVPLRRLGRISRFVTTLLRLILPVTALCATLLLAFCLRDEPVSQLDVLAEIDPRLDPSGWLTLGYLVLPLTFFVLNLTSRRYGPDLTFTAMLLSWVVVAGALGWAFHAGLIRDLEAEIAPYPLALSFFAALFVGQLVAILFFDWLRGIPWWQAPFFAALFGGVVFSLLFHVGSDMALDEVLGQRVVVEVAIQFVWALGQLVPAYLLRSSIRPLPGFGGG
jgi:uncharacterized PurR-regulated membrane protein YhhQ (DUF165 family)